MRRRYRWLLSSLAAAASVAVLLTTAGLAYLATHEPKLPYPPAGRALAWQIGWQERAFKFHTVVPGRVYRSGLPDERFLSYLHETYGIRSIVNLTTAHTPEFKQHAAALGIRIHHIPWQGWPPPAHEELARVLGLMDSDTPLLVHCTAGRDRTGYAVAAYRILRQGWDSERAFSEMNSFRHKAWKHPWYQGQLREWESDPASVPAGLRREAR